MIGQVLLEAGDSHRYRICVLIRAVIRQLSCVSKCFLGDRASKKQKQRANIGRNQYWSSEVGTQGLVRDVMWVVADGVPVEGDVE